MSVRLQRLNGYSEEVTYNGVEFLLKCKIGVGETEPVLDVALEFKDPTLQKAFMDSCRARPTGLITQTWIAARGENLIYLKYNFNNVWTRYCDNTEHAFEKRILRGGARLVWCLFYRAGLRLGAFGTSTRVDLYADGEWKAGTPEKLEIRKTLREASEYMRLNGPLPDDHPVVAKFFKATVRDARIMEEEMAELIKYYEKLGFVVTKKQKNAYDIYAYNNGRRINLGPAYMLYASMESTVAKSLEAVCKVMQKESAPAEKPTPPKKPVVKKAKAQSKAKKPKAAKKPKKATKAAKKVVKKAVKKPKAAKKKAVKKPKKKVTKKVGKKSRK
jgi:hypothetical protein